jgi:hypothetical protein
MKLSPLFIPFFIVTQLFAGGPLSTHNGKVVRFKSDTVKYHLDRGPFGIFTNQQARDLANTSFLVWEEVPTAVISFNHTAADTLPVDVNGSNFLQYTTLSSVKVDSINPIIFDSDGGITNALFGSGAADFVIGFAWTEDIDGDGFYDEGEAVMNGKFAQGTQSSFTYDEWKSTFVHEFGHFIGLDHTQINGDCVDDPALTQYVPTMFPTSTVDDVPLGELNPDDIAAVSLIYPHPSFDSTTGSISGSVVRAGGAVVRGANVVAISTGADSMMNRISTVTDYFIQNTGDFTIAGLSPGSYYVRIEPIDPMFTEGSGVGPYSFDDTDISFINPVITEYYNSANESGDPLTDMPSDRSPIVVAAGAITAGIDFIANTKLAGPALLAENFDYSGLLSANGWSVHSGTTNPVSTAAGLSYAGYAGSGIGNAAFIGNLGGEDVNFAIEMQNSNGTEIFSSLLVNISDTATSKSGDYFFHLGYQSSSTSFTAFSSRLFAKIVSGNVQFGISNTSTATYAANNFSKNTTYLAVMKYTINAAGNDEAKLWVFSSLLPASEEAAGTPLVIHSSTAGQDFINAIGLRQGSSTASAAVVVDGITVNTAWPIGVTSVHKNNPGFKPEGFTLHQNYPNPFNPVTTIEFSVPSFAEEQTVTLRIYDILGREVAELINGKYTSGQYLVRFDGSKLNSGVYFYRFSAGNTAILKKMMLLK